MFDIGFWELFLLMVLALVVIGPERLPRAARTAGYWLGKARRYVEGVKSDVESEFDLTEMKRLMHNQEVQINELQRKLNETAELDLAGEHHEAHRHRTDEIEDNYYDDDEDDDDLPHPDEVHEIIEADDKRKASSSTDASNSTDDTPEKTDATDEDTAVASKHGDKQQA